MRKVVLISQINYIEETMHLPIDIIVYKTYCDMFPKHILWYSTLFKIKLHPT